MHFLVVFALAAMLGGCALQRAQVANEAQDKMVGLTKEQVLACMGPPGNRMTEGATEVWSYQSGDGTVISSTNANVYGVRGTRQAFGSATSVSSSRFCQINVVMSSGRVSKIAYQGPTGGLLTAGEQCAYAVQNCTK